ncbi:MAG: 3-oxoacyl-ACP reductase [Acidimicrobiia bacterium]|nr:3-oxoacyl-ACP reductase [Acidimicrobiia bacterium]
MGSLSGKTAIVTGGGAGVGRGIALALAAEGAQVVVCGRTLAPLEAVQGEITARGGAAHAVVCDVSDPTQLPGLVDAAISTFGSVDILVNNAMLIPHGSLLEIAESVIDGAWQSGPMAALRLMRLCHPHLRDGGVVINVSSAVSLQAVAPNRGMYAATKAALNTISRAAATEWGPDGIRVNVVMPFARSDAVARFLENEPEYAAEVIAAVPLRRVGEPEEDIGRAVAFLCGPAANYITGVTLPLDGGSAYLR